VGGNVGEGKRGRGVVAAGGVGFGDDAAVLEGIGFHEQGRNYPAGSTAAATTTTSAEGQRRDVTQVFGNGPCRRCRSRRRAPSLAASKPRKRRKVENAK